MKNGTVDMTLAESVMQEPNTAAYIYASMMLGNAIRMLCELGATESVIQESVENTLKLFSQTQN